MKIFVSDFGHETHTFSPEKTTIEALKRFGYKEGSEIPLKFANGSYYIGGMMKAAKEEKVDLTFGISILAAGPLLTRDCFEHFTEKTMRALAENLDGLDGICLSLHGAGCAEGIDDIEGELLERVRGVVGNEMPITVTLDLHANVSDRMVSLSNGLFGIKTYPHVDQPATGYLAMKSLVSMIRSKKKLVTVAVKVPLLVPFHSMVTDGGPAKILADFAAALKEQFGLVDASVFHGFAYSDTPISGLSVVAVGSDPEKAKIVTRLLADRAWELRDETNAGQPGVEETLDIASEYMKQDDITLISDTSDFPGGGTPGDGTYLLSGLIKRNIENCIFASIYDPECAELAHNAGVGARLDLLVGGKCDGLHGDPLALQGVEVMALSDGHFNYTSPMYKGLPYCVGKTARLKYGNVEFVVTSVPRQTHDDRMIAITGVDVTDYKLVCIKSAVAFRCFFETIKEIKHILLCNPPGLCSCDLSSFDYQKLRRPIYPLDKDFDFKA